MLDYLVVGLGLAGVSFCEQLEKSGKTYAVISDTSQTSSIVAGGLYNPVILKRFTLAWKAKEQFEQLLPFYTSLEHRLNVKLIYQFPVLRRFASVEEQNLWFEAIDKKGVGGFLSPTLIKNVNPCVDAPLGYGEVLGTGKVDTALLIAAYQKLLLSKNIFWQETFDFDALQITADCVRYKTLKAKRIIFAEGFGAKSNPFFSYLPLTSTKGEYLVIKAPDLKETNAIKSSVFIIPWENDVYRVGATYKWKDTTNLPTEASREELQQKLDAIIKCKYQVIDQLAGVRPTVTDRRPLLGQHPVHDKLYILNGFGSRGVMIAPYAAEQLFRLIENNQKPDSAIDIARFEKKYFKS